MAALRKHADKFQAQGTLAADYRAGCWPLLLADPRDGVCSVPTTPFGRHRPLRRRSDCRAVGGQVASDDIAAILKNAISPSVIMAIRPAPLQRSAPIDMRLATGEVAFQDRSALLPGRLARWPGHRAQGFRIPECPRENTVLIAVACQRTDVRRHRVCPVLGCAWGARDGRVGHAGTSAQVRLLGPEERDSLSCSISAPPAGFEPAHTAPECNPAYSRYQQERGLRCMHLARMGRAKPPSPASPSAAIAPMIRKSYVALTIIPA
jgi:hypothetical protein